MSWAKKKTIKTEISEIAGKNQTETSLKPDGGKESNMQKSNKKAIQMTKEDIWEYTKMRIISYAPVMIPLVYLPVVHTDGKAGILCNGKEIYISDKFWELPLDDIMYMTVKEFTQVLLGFRVEKNIEISDSVVEKDIVKLEAEMMFTRVQNMLCDTLLLCRPGDVGVSKSLIKPSEKLLSCIHKSFGVYTDCNKRYVKYIDAADSLTAFKDEWSKKSLNSVSDQLTKCYNLCRNKTVGPYTDIKFSITPNPIGRFSRSIVGISYIPNGNFLIIIPPELTKQTMMQLQGGGKGEKAMSGKAGNSKDSGNEAKGDSGSENQNNQNEAEDSSGNLSKTDGSSSGNAANKSRGSENGTGSINRGSEYSEGNINAGNSENSGNENKGSSEGSRSTDSGEPKNGENKNGNEYASEFSSVLNKDMASMDMNTYKELLSEAKRYLDESPIAYDNSGFGKRIAETYKRLYKVSSVWWKKAQSMIMSYVPDVNSSYRRPNKKFAMTEFILPSQCEKAQSCEVDRLRVFLDSSGSMTSEDFNIFKSLIKSAQSFFPRDTLAYEFNTAVSPMKCVNGKIIGSPAHTGGTDINCVTKFISTQPDRGKALNIVVTDGGFDWEALVSYMKKEDRLSKFIFIITTASRNYLGAVKEINQKRLKVLLINEYGKF